ncbi:photosystem II 5 kDa protein, chloroplastic-like [Henckelia pumila]|uniref:photosystem II 5 kDa protein, chloroplastic-like n=1 Tax=Henckelia pumila TaxID=405737 RepID=UPI003C6E87EC
MASTFTITSFLGGKQLLTTTPRHGVVAVRASLESEKMAMKEERSSSRRDMMLAVVAVAACSAAKVAMADEPKPGTSAAKKKYVPICVTMPTARICRK